MKDKDIFKDVFSEKLGNFEVPVRPELWSSISSQIGTSAATSVASGMSFLSKLIIGGSISAAVVTGVILLYPSKKEVKQIVKDTKSSIEIPVNNNSINTIETTSSVKNNNKMNIIDKESKSEFYRGFTCNFPEVLPLSVDHFINSDNTILINDIIEPSASNLTIDPLLSKTKENDQKIESVLPIVEKGNINENNTSKKLILPNLFSPDNDGKADLFYIESDGLTNFSLVIFDSKNNIIFKSEDPSFKWDGIKINGDLAENGKYIYIITAINKEGEEISEYSFLTINKN